MLVLAILPSVWQPELDMSGGWQLAMVPPNRHADLRQAYKMPSEFDCHPSGGHGCLGEGCLGEGCLRLPGQVWEFRFLPSCPSFSRENRNSKKYLGKRLEVPTSFYQTSATTWIQMRLNQDVDRRYASPGLERSRSSVLKLSQITVAMRINVIWFSPNIQSLSYWYELGSKIFCIHACMWITRALSKYCSSCVSRVGLSTK